jgi:hypothetical protein
VGDGALRKDAKELRRGTTRRRHAGAPVHREPSKDLLIGPVFTSAAGVRRQPA